MCLTLPQMPPEIVEQYLKVIYKVTEDGGLARTTDIASTMDIAPASVTEMLHKLSAKGYIKHEPYKGAKLTAKGMRIACKVTRKHRLLERFLSDFIGVRGKSGHEQACKMEHALTDESEQQLCRLMNHPSECPDGKKIPKCDRGIPCEACRDTTVRLIDLKEGESAVVSHLTSDNKDELCKVLSMGFVPGSEVVVEKKVPMGGPLIVKLKGTRVAIAREIGDMLHMVRPT